MIGGWGAMPEKTIEAKFPIATLTAKKRELFALRHSNYKRVATSLQSNGS
jgi:hypothetical protein